MMYWLPADIQDAFLEGTLLQINQAIQNQFIAILLKLIIIDKWKRHNVHIYTTVHNSNL